MQIDLLVAEVKRLANDAVGGFEAVVAHAHHPGVEVDAGGFVNGGQHQMVEMVDHDLSGALGPGGREGTAITPRRASSSIWASVRPTSRRIGRVS